MTFSWKQGCGQKEKRKSKNKSEELEETREPTNSNFKERVVFFDQIYRLEPDFSS